MEGHAPKKMMHRFTIHPQPARTDIASSVCHASVLTVPSALGLKSPQEAWLDLARRPVIDRRRRLRALNRGKGREKAQGASRRTKESCAQTPAGFLVLHTFADLRTASAFEPQSTLG